MKLLNSVAAALALTYCATEVNGNDIVKKIVSNSMQRLHARGAIKTGVKSVRSSPASCVDGGARVGDEVFPCSEVDFLSFVSLEELEIVGPHPFEHNCADIWGWLSPSKQEITLIGMDNGLAIVDTTDPISPCILGKMKSGRSSDVWSDMKVYKNTAYFVMDNRLPDAGNRPDYGIEVIDLLQFDGLDCSAPGFEILEIEPNFVVTNHGRSHNVVIDTESGLLVSVGTEKCGKGGLMMYDVATNPLEPQFVGCARADGYTHDAQCLIYDGPDVEHHGKEICFAFNEETLTIWDVSDAADPIILSRTFYPNQAYTHQGWVNNDLTKVLLDDELDELCNSDHAPADCPDLVFTNLTGLETTSTNVFDITNLENPVLESVFVHADLSIDHNLYVWGLNHRKGWGGNPPMEFYPDPNYAYLNNYLAGLRILDIHSSDSHDWFEAGFFDVAPEVTEVEFAGAWSGYLHPSGAYALSHIERGLFMLAPRMAYTAEFPKSPAPTPAPSAYPTDFPTGGGAPVAAPVGTPSSDDSSDTVVFLIGIAVALSVVVVILAVALATVLGFGPKKKAATSEEVVSA